MSVLIDNIESNLCISCAACEYLSALGGGGSEIALKYNGKGMYTPKIKKIKKLSQSEQRVIERICPAGGYNIVAIGKNLYPDDNYDYHIGRYSTFFAARSLSNIILEKASSGGIMTSVASFLLKEKIVDGVITTKFLYGKRIVPVSIIATSVDELIECQGSKYMPVPIFKILHDIKNFNGKLAMIGTPCQIATLRNLQQEYPEFKKVKYTIGNFCGGYRDLREYERFIKIAGFTQEEITYFQYRGDGQPGRMLIKTRDKEWAYPYPDYAKLTGNIKYFRCRVCVDATAELADISCGDAWLDRFIGKKSTGSVGKGGGWSMVIIRNPELQSVIKKMIDYQLIEKESISIEELIKSQKQNIVSKKDRFQSRSNFLKKIGKKLPYFDGGYNVDSTTNLFFEAKVYFSQLYKLFLERIGLYSIIIKSKANDRR